MQLCVATLDHLSLAATPHSADPLQGDWEVESTGGTKFADVDFEAGEWTEYCEKLGESVAVYKIEGKFEQHRG